MSEPTAAVCSERRAHDYLVHEIGGFQRETVLTCRSCGHTGKWVEFYRRSQAEEIIRAQLQPQMDASGTAAEPAPEVESAAGEAHV